MLYLFLGQGAWISNIENMRNKFLTDSTIEEPIYVIAGSSMGNSFDSNFVSKKLNREVYNISFTLSHKSSFILNYIADKAKKGDIIVYGPEFDNYYDSNDNLSIEQLASIYNNPNLFKYQSTKQKGIFISNIPKMNILLTYRKIKNYLKPQLFNVNYLNKRGDYNNQTNVKKTWKPSEISRYDKNNYEGRINSNFKKQILKTKKIIEEKGAYFFITFPPLASSEYDVRFKKDIENFYKNTNIKLIGKPNTYIFHDSLFLNHPYHTTNTGTLKRSAKFVENFKPILIELK